MSWCVCGHSDVIHYDKGRISADPTGQPCNAPGCPCRAFVKNDEFDEVDLRPKLEEEKK